MEESIEVLQQERKALYHKIEKIGDFRRGIISVNYRRCGKKNCVCAKEGHPGHGPRYLWNATIKLVFFLKYAIHRLRTGLDLLLE